MSNELIPLKERNLKLMSDFDRQRELFERFGVPAKPYLMSHNAVIETGDGKYKLVKRENPVSFETDLNGHVRCVAFAQRTRAEVAGLGGFREFANPETTRRVIENELTLSIEPGEVAAWGSYC